MVNENKNLSNKQVIKVLIANDDIIPLICLYDMFKDYNHEFIQFDVTKACNGLIALNHVKTSI